MPENLIESRYNPNQHLNRTKSNQIRSSKMAMKTQWQSQQQEWQGHVTLLNIVYTVVSLDLNTLPIRTHLVNKFSPPI